jgi:hypothetical protein
MQMFHTKKNQLSAWLLAIAAVALSPAAANAATAGDISAAQVINTSALFFDSGSYPACTVVNVSTAEISVVIELIDLGGNVLLSLTQSLPGGSGNTLQSASLPNGAYARCRFTTNYASTTIRANLMIFHPLSGGTYQMYAISEAR